MDEPLFPIYSARSQQDMSAMVTVLSQVLGYNGENPARLSESVHENSLALPDNQTSIESQHSQPQRVQEQGVDRIIYRDISLCFCVCMCVCTCLSFLRREVLCDIGS